MGLAFGGEDYLTDLEGGQTSDQRAFLLPRFQVANAARAYGIFSLDTPFLSVGDLKGYRESLVFAKSLGFSGSLLLHPTQVSIANEVFSPSAAEVERARKVLSAVDTGKEKDLAVGLLEGELIGPPMAKRAQKVLNLWEKIQRLELGADASNK
jgi:citrate lyase subunit beta/citryl-CoA lyase